jgi:hypothetical protein
MSKILGSGQNGFASSTAMWFGTMSSTIPGASSASRRSSSSPPSSSRTLRGSTWS